jgi:hypothetical protein
MLIVSQLLHMVVLNIEWIGYNDSQAIIQVLPGCYFLQ